MHASQVLHRWLTAQLPPIHRARLAALWSMVDAVFHARALSVTALGRVLGGTATVKHKIKRSDRLVGNTHLIDERRAFYQGMIQVLLRGLREPVILIDWSELKPDLSQQLLRAALPVGGRALTLWEEVHPGHKLGNRKVQHRFLRTLQALLPDHVDPIIVADAGFRVPFYREVERLGWRWVGRIRGRDHLAWQSAPGQWFAAREVFARASITPRCLGSVLWVRSNPLAAVVYLVRLRRAGRTQKTVRGTTARSRHADVQRRRALEPWLLVASTRLAATAAKRIVGYYRLRMQIEEGFRDTKSQAYGMGMEVNRSIRPQRLANLALIAALAQFAAYLVGAVVEQCKSHLQFLSNTRRKRRELSLITLGRLVLSGTPLSLSLSQLPSRGGLAQALARAASAL